MNPRPDIAESPPIAAAELPAGTPLHGGRYRVRQVLGRGGFGITYAADDLRLERVVAIKELFPESVVRHGVHVLAVPEARAAFDDAKARFLREARVLARFSHPSIVRAYEVFEEHDTAYLVMELIEGRTLSELLRDRSPMPEAEVLGLAEHIAEALEAVHDAGVLHRDVNPSNIVVTPSGRVVVIDFGIARPYDRSTTGPFTRMVTPGYAPPEQYGEAGDLGLSADVYALAATLYRLLTGHTPTSALDRQQGRPLPSPRSLQPAVSKAVSDAVLDGLELDPAHRPQTMRAFVQRLGAVDLEPGQVATVVPAAPAVPGAPRPPEADHRPGAPAAAPPAAPVLVPRPPVLDRRMAPVRPPSGVPGRAPGGVGPVPAGRWKVTVPVAAALVSLASASVVPVLVFVILVVAPLLATWGDLVVHDHRRRSGQSWRRWHQWSPSAVAPVRALRNVGASVVRAVPAIAVAAVTVVAGVLTRDPGLHVAHDALVRIGGALAAALVLWPLARGMARFRSGIGIDRGLTWFMDGRGRLLQAGWILWVVAVGLTAAGLWLSPEVWPFTG